MEDQVILHEEALDELYSWIDGIPLSRPKKNIARDFSDGVLCAEVIAHFQPKIVDMHNYFPASSVMQKKINWNTLCRKILSKLGIRLSDNTIQLLVEAKPGAIEQLLWDLRRKFQLDLGIRSDYTSRVTQPSQRPVSAGTGFNRFEQRELTSYRNNFDSELTEDTPPSMIRSKIPTAALPSIGTGSFKPISSSASAAQNAGGYQNSYQTQGYIANPAKSIPSNTEAVNNNSSGPPTQIIYRGHKMVPLLALEEREREIKSLEQANKILVTKVGRTETLINVKDQRLEDLTHQLHNLRTLYERVTQQTWTGY